MPKVTKKEVEEVWEEVNNLKRAVIRRSAAATGDDTGKGGRMAKRGGGMKMG